jgi:ABC-2 type transport system permease protein/ribosome-dependent ATPase
MNRTRVLAIASKEWREIVRDRLFFALAFVVPAALMLLFGFGLSLDVEKLPLAVVDHDRTPMSREYVHRFIDSRYFDFKGYADDENQLDRYIVNNELRAVLVIAPHFERNLMSGRPAQVQTLVDGTFPFRAQTVKGYVAAINAAFNVETLAQALSQIRGAPQAQVREMLPPVGIEVRFLYNQSMKSIWSIAPKLLMVIMMISPPFLTALGIVREKESGSIFNIYSSTASRGEFLAGKLLPYVMISTLNILVLWLLAIFLFGTPFKGDPLFFLLSAILYVSCTTGIGLLVSVAVKTQVAAMIGTTIVTVVPAVLYSGVLIPVSSLSSMARVIAHLLPGMYFADIAMGSFLKGLGLSTYWPQVLALMLYALVLFTAGYLLFRKRVAS